MSPTVTWDLDLIWWNLSDNTQLPLEPQEALNLHICSSTSKVWNWWSYPLLKRGRGTMTFSKRITTHLKHPHCVLYIKCHYKHFISMQKNTKTKQNTVTISLRAERLSWQKSNIECSCEMLATMWLGISANEWQALWCLIQVHLDMTLKVYGLGWNQRVSSKVRHAPLEKHVIFIKSYHFKQP